MRYVMLLRKIVVDGDEERYGFRLIPQEPTDQAIVNLLMNALIENAVVAVTFADGSTVGFKTDGAMLPMGRSYDPDDGGGGYAESEEWKL
jgi:hypothetical protein